MLSRILVLLGLLGFCKCFCIMPGLEGEGTPMDLQTVIVFGTRVENVMYGPILF